MEYSSPPLDMLWNYVPNTMNVSQLKMSPWVPITLYECKGKRDNGGTVLLLGFHFGSKKTVKLSIVFEDLSRYSVFFRTKVKP